MNTRKQVCMQGMFSICDYWTDSAYMVSLGS